MRVKRGTKTRRRHKALLSQVKGYKHGNKNIFRRSNQALIKAGSHSYNDRRLKKRVFRRLWSIQINAASRTHGLNYSRFIYGLKKARVELNRKSLSLIAKEQPEQFKIVVDKVKKELGIG